MTFGQSLNNYLFDSPEAVGQVVVTRLKLWQGEFWLDLNAGTPWFQQILGKSPAPTRDSAIRQVILQTPFVTGLTNYSSTVDLRTRALTVSCTVQTAFGATTITVPFTAGPPAGPFELGVSPVGGLQGTGSSGGGGF